MAVENPGYYGGAVPALGPINAPLLIVGLAPGRRGAHRTGLAFHGDASGRALFAALETTGFGLPPVADTTPAELYQCRLTNIVKCLPPENKPTRDELDTCADFLAAELIRPQVIVALGGVAHRAIVRCLGGRQVDYPFGHNQAHRLPDGRWLIDSYHCSRYNFNTGRLTAPMLAGVFEHAAERLAVAGWSPDQQSP